MSDPKNKNKSRPSISVTGTTYVHLRAAHPSGSLAAFVDKAVAIALDDPAIAARLVAKCRQASVRS